MSSILRKGELEFRNRGSVYQAFDRKRIQALIQKEEEIAPFKPKRASLKSLFSKQ